MNYDQTRQAAQMRVAEMGQVLRHCGLRLRDEYTLDDAIEFAGKRVLELIDDGYAGMLALLAAHSHAGRRVSDENPSPAPCRDGGGVGLRRGVVWWRVVCLVRKMRTGNAGR